MNGAGNGEGEQPSVVVVEEEGPPPNAGNTGDGGGGLLGDAPNFGATEADTLLVVATLITALTYQLGTNIPGGYWQDDVAGAGGHVAGDPIMRDKHRRRYWLFMAASWAGFGTSMLLTVGLITGVPARSRFVQYAFLVACCGSGLLHVLLLPFVTSLAVDDLVNVSWVAGMAMVDIVTMQSTSSQAGRRPLVFSTRLLVLTV